MIWLLLLTYWMCYTLDLTQKIPKLKLAIVEFIPYLYFMQSFTRAANKYLNIFFEGAFPLITRSIIL